MAKKKQKNKAAARLGSLGGKARWANLSPEERSALGKKLREKRKVIEEEQKKKSNKTV